VLPLCDPGKKKRCAIKGHSLAGSEEKERNRSQRGRSLIGQVLVKEKSTILGNASPHRRRRIHHALEENDEPNSSLRAKRRPGVAGDLQRAWKQKNWPLPEKMNRSAKKKGARIDEETILYAETPNLGVKKKCPAIAGRKKSSQ